MPEIIEQYYAPLLKGHGFIPDPDNQQYGSLGISWKLSPEIGEGSYWTYGQKDLYDIKIHNFSRGLSAGILPARVFEHHPL